MTTSVKCCTFQAEFHAHDDEVDLEDFCDIMERHQPENLIVTNWGGGDSDDEDSGNEEEDGTEGRKNRNETGGGGGGSGGMGAGGGKVAFTREEVISNLVELFKEVNGLT